MITRSTSFHMNTCPEVNAFHDLKLALVDTIDKIPEAKFGKIYPSQMEKFLENYADIRLRYYHTAIHILDGLKMFSNFGPEDPVRDFAWIWHDVIWNNELASADVAFLFANLLDLCIDDVDKIYALIRSTDHKNLIINDPLFIDVDLSILGAKHERFLEYRKQVEREYLTIYTEEQFAEGTKSWANKMLKRDSIFYTKELKHLEKPARKNLLSLLE